MEAAETLGLSRQTVREVELAALERKYRCVPLGDVRRIGIDEICVFHREHGGRQYEAYGYRDYRYFRLKVFDLPNLKPRESDC